jgi:L-threonylcarbamoyladenylate synthase
MKIICNPTLGEIKKAAKALKDGHLVAFPTETVYGLGADATNEKAVSRIYSVKGRPTNHPLIVHISSINQLDIWAKDIPEYAIKLAKEFWPGPMTLILTRTDLAKDFVTGGQDSVGLRVPDQSVAFGLLNEFEKLGGYGIAAPSANRFGAVSPTTSEAVKQELDKFLQAEDLILDAGHCAIGIESTIIDCRNSSPIILRPGVVTKQIIESRIDSDLAPPSHYNEIRTSGLLDSHYSPKAKVVLNGSTDPGDGFIAISKIPTPLGAIRLASPNSNKEYARELYEALRSGDQKGLKKIVVIPPSGRGIANAILDRLEKASSKKLNITI